MRGTLSFLHLWFGLATALFLFIAGLTGAIISWDHELDAWLNPAFYAAAPGGAAMSPLQLAALVEAADPQARISYLPLGAEPSEAVQISVVPRLDSATDKLYPLDYNEVAINPVTGAIQGRRMWGLVSLSRENLLPFLYKLHYSMHIPARGGVELGIWLMGIIGIV